MGYLENIDQKILIVFVLIIFISFFLKKISQYLNLYDRPSSKRKFQRKPTSTINGLLILITLNIYLFLDIFLFNELYFKLNIIILILINTFYILGYIDDIKDLSAKKKNNNNHIIFVSFYST